MSQQVPELMIGIAGGSCSGKTTLEENLRVQLGDELSTLPFDDLFVGMQALDGIEVTDWESPDLYRWDDYYDHIKSLKLGRGALLAAAHPESLAAGVSQRFIESRSVIVVAGFLALYDTRVNELFDARIFIDLPEKEIVRRRLARAQPGYPWNNEEYITSRLLPGHRRFVEPQRARAEYTLDGMLPPRQLTETAVGIIHAISPVGLW